MDERDDGVINSARNKDITHKIMSSIPSRNTRPEILLRKALFSRGYRYRVNYRRLKGTPDIVLTKARIAIFIDGDFWHGNNWRLRGYASHEDEMEHYSAYWRDKIERNIRHDQEVNAALAHDGWIVLRFWESDLKKDISPALYTIETWYHNLMGL